MNTQITTYYIPENPIILRGSIYTFYLNNNTNLDLSTILNPQPFQLNDLIQQNISSNQESPIIVSKEEYQKLLKLNEEIYTLIEERTKDIQEFIKKEPQTTTELTKINIERQGLIKKLTKTGDSNATK